MHLNCVVLEKTLKSPLDCKEIKPVKPKGNQSLIFIERTEAENKTPILWPPDAKNWLIGKDRDAGKDWKQEKGVTQDEMVGRHHRLNGHEFEQASGAGDGQGSLACFSPWSRKESDVTEQPNWTELSSVVNGFHYVNIWSLCTAFGERFCHEQILSFVKCFFCVYCIEVNMWVVLM